MIVQPPSLDMGAFNTLQPLSFIIQTSSESPVINLPQQQQQQQDQQQQQSLPVEHTVSDESTSESIECDGKHHNGSHLPGLFEQLLLWFMKCVNNNYENF